MITADNITVDQIRWVRVYGPRTVEYLNAADMALAARRGEYGAGREKAGQALAVCAAYYNERGPEPARSARGEQGRCEVSQPTLPESLGSLLNSERLSLATALQGSTYDQRVAFFDWLKSRWCLHCGAADPRCQCQNDD